MPFSEAAPLQSKVRKIYCRLYRLVFVLLANHMNNIDIIDIIVKMFIKYNYIIHYTELVLGWTSNYRQ